MKNTTHNEKESVSALKTLNAAQATETCLGENPAGYTKVLAEAAFFVYGELSDIYWFSNLFLNRKLERRKKTRMKSAEEFEYVRTGLTNQIDREILGLKRWLDSKTDEELTSDPKIVGETVSRIFYTMKGLEKLNSVMGFIDCWEENGDIPQLSQKASFEKEDD